MNCTWLGLMGLGLTWGYAQSPPCTCTVRGRVTEREGRAIAGAVVLLKGTRQHALTDSLGFYAVKNLCQGRYVLVCRLVSYEPYESTFLLTQAETAQDLTLRVADVHLRNVVVTARRGTASAQARTDLSGTDLDRTRGQSLGEVLKAVAGVTSLQMGSNIAKPVIHGLHSSRVLILNHGVRLEGQQWGAEHAPEVDPFVAKKLSVVKGAAAVRYGADAVGGVVLVEPDPLPDTSGVSGELNLVGFSNGRQGVASGLVQGGLRRVPGFGWRAQGTAKRGGDVRAAAYRLVNTGIRELNFSLAAGYRARRAEADVFFSQFNTLIGIFAGSHIGSTTDLTAALQSPRPRPEYTPARFSDRIERPYQDVQHNLLKTHAFWRPAAGGTLSLTLARQFNYRAEYDVARNRNSVQQHFRLTTYTGEVLWEMPGLDWPKTGRLTGTLGVSGLAQENLSTGFEIAQPLNRTVLIPNFRNQMGGVFLVERLVTPRWEWELGLRLDARHLQTFRRRLAAASIDEVIEENRFNHNLSGTFGAVYTVREGFTVRFHSGTAWRPPNVSELYSDGVHHGAAAFEAGNPNLQPETAGNTSLTGSFADKRVALELHLFYNYIQNFIYLNPQDSVRLTVRGAFPYFRYTQVDAAFRGLDASGSVRLTDRLTLTSRYAFLRVRDVRNDRYLVNIPANRWEASLRYDFGKRGAHLLLGSQHVARQTRVEPASDFAPPPPAYWLFNAEASLTFTAARRPLNLSLSATNLLNASYREYLNRFRYFADDLGRNVALRTKWIF